jgi:hypothetical protein
LEQALGGHSSEKPIANLPCLFLRPPLAYLDFANDTVNANQAIGTNAYGGGIYAFDSTVSLQNCTVNGNKAKGSLVSKNGGIASTGGSLSLVSTTVNGNTP